MKNIILLLLLLSVSLFAQIQPIPGWSKNGVSVPESRFGYASPLVADLNGDSTLDIVSVSVDGVVRAHSNTGALLWRTNLPNFGCKKSDLAHSSPAIGDIFGNGVKHIVVGYGGLSSRVCGGGVVAINAATGATVWNFDVKKYAALKKFYSISHGIFSSVALADTDFDGQMEIGFGGLDRNIYLLNSNGTVRWYYQAADTVFSSPTFANIDDTPELEMIIGTDVFGNKKMKPIVKSGGYLYALRTKPAKVRNLYRFRNSDIVIWLNNYEQVIQSSPAVGELVADNPGLEIAVTSGCFYPERNPNKIGKWLKVVSARTGKTLRQLPLENCTSSSPAIADVDNNGTNDVVFSYAKNNVHNISGKVVAYSPNESRVLWATQPLAFGKTSSQLGFFVSNAIADLDGNGSLEVVVPNAGALTVLAGATGQQLSDNSLYVRSSSATPTVVDINNDGRNDIIAVGSGLRSLGAIYAFTNFRYNSPAAAAPAYGVPWAQFKKTNQRNAVY